MSDHEDDTDAPVALVSFDIPGMLAKQSMLLFSYR